MTFALVAGSLLVFGALDQTSPVLAPQYDQVRAERSAEGRFVDAIEDRLGGRGEVLQLPYLPFPEVPPLLRMHDYDPLKGYLHSGKGIRWSYGAMKGRAEDWQAEYAQHPLRVQLRAGAAIGFDGVWVDSFGLEDPAATLREVERVSGTTPLVSEGERFSFFDLRPYAARVRDSSRSGGSSALRQAVLRPVVAAYGAGFTGVEEGEDERWRWMGSRGEITLTNPGARPRRTSVHARLSASGPATVRVTAGGREVKVLRLRGERRSLDFTISVAPGSSVVTLATDAPPAPKPVPDSRDLRLQLFETEVLDAALATAP